MDQSQGTAAVPETSLRITPRIMDEYLADLANRGRAAGTVKAYPGRSRPDDRTKP